MRRRKATHSQQWERLMGQREATIAKLVRIEQKAAKLRKSMARRITKAAKQAAWDQSPLDPELNDISLGM